MVSILSILQDHVKPRTKFSIDIFLIFYALVLLLYEHFQSFYLSL